MKLSRRSLIKGALAAGSVLAAGCASERAVGLAGGAPAKGKGKKILILGGTGFIGPQLVEAAQARGHTVTLFNRGKTRPNLFPDVEKLHGDRDGHLEALQGRRWDAVIDTSGYVPRIVKASAELLAPAVERYVFISTISVYSDLSQPDMDESGPLEKLSDEKSEDVKKDYGALKALCEQAVEKALPGRGLTLRPGVIVGPGDESDRFTFWPVRVARGGEVLAPGSAADPVQFIDVRDLAQWTLLALEHGEVGTFNTLGPVDRLTLGELLTTCKAVTGSDATFTWGDPGFLEAQHVRPWSDMPLWLPPSGETRGVGSLSNAKAVARGLRFRPLVETTRDTLAWFKTLPAERQAKLRAGLPASREAEVLTALHQANASIHPSAGP